MAAAALLSVGTGSRPDDSAGQRKLLHGTGSSESSYFVIRSVATVTERSNAAHRGTVENRPRDRWREYRRLLTRAQALLVALAGRTSPDATHLREDAPAHLRAAGPGELSFGADRTQPERKGGEACPRGVDENHAVCRDSGCRG